MTNDSQNQEIDPFTKMTQRIDKILEQDKSISHRTHAELLLVQLEITRCGAAYMCMQIQMIANEVKYRIHKTEPKKGLWERIKSIF
jgi:hypothetical protein